jgi:hypothetical protein
MPIRYRTQRNRLNANGTKMGSKKTPDGYAPPPLKSKGFGIVGDREANKNPKSNKVRIICAASGLVFQELMEMIAFSMDEISLLKKGHKFSEISIVDELDVGKGSVPVSNYKVDYNFVIKAFRNWYPMNLKYGKKILFQTEECWNNREQGHYRSDLLSGFDRILEMYDENVKLKQTEIVRYCPVGYSPVFEKNLPIVTEDIDVLFHGSLTVRRKGFESALRTAGFNCVFSDKLYGIEREKMIMRSKVVLNIKAHPKWSYGPLHCLPTQCQKKFMLAEKANGGYGPFVPGRHLSEYNGMDDCLEKVDYWISHEKERKEFSINAYETMKKECKFTEIFLKAMEGMI